MLRVGAKQLYNIIVFELSTCFLNFNNQLTETSINKMSMYYYTRLNVHVVSEFF